MPTLEGSIGAFAFRVAPLAVPREMVIDTNFETPIFAEDAGGALDITVLSPPASSNPVLSYDLIFVGATEDPSGIPVDAAMPFAIGFTPITHPSIWEWGVAAWDATAYIRAISSDGDGILSSTFEIDVDQSTTYYITNGDWTFGEVLDGVAAEDISGRGLVTFSVDRVIPDGMELRVYIGNLAYGAANFAAIHDVDVSVLIEPDDEIMSAAGHATGSRVTGVLLWHELESNLWHQASSIRFFDVIGLIDEALPAVVVAPSITGTGKIGVALNGATGTWTESPTFTTQWVRGASLEIAGATTIDYTPVAADDLHSLRLRVRATNAAGTSEAFSAPIAITYTAPSVVTPLSDLVLTQASGTLRTVDISGTFTGANLSFAVSGSSAVTVNQTDLGMAIDRSNVLAITPIVLTASNSGGQVSDTFNLTITAVGTAAAPVVVSVGGSNAQNDPAFVAYETDDMILGFAFNGTTAAGITLPNIALLTGQFDWNAIADGVLTNISARVGYRRAATDGLDGLQGPWTGASAVRYAAIRNVAWADPIGAIASAFTEAAANVDHLGLTLETSNSIVIDYTVFAAVSGIMPGLRPDATTLASNSASGMRFHLSRSTVVPTPFWLAAADVANSGGTSGRQFTIALEARGSTDAGGIIWPAPLAQGDLLVTEVTDPAVALAQGFTGESGHLKAVASGSVDPTVTTASGDFQLVREFLGGPSPGPSATSTDITASSTTYSTGALSVGATAYPRAWWRLGTGATAQYGLAWAGPTFTIVGLDQVEEPPVGSEVLGAISTTALNAAIACNMSEWRSSVTGQANGLGNFGPAYVAEAYAAYNGQTSGDSPALAQLEHSLQGTQCPNCAAGFAAQWDLIWATGTYLIFKTPRLWAQVSSVNRRKIDALMRAMGASAAAICCDRYGAGESMHGSPTNKNGSPNFSAAFPGLVLVVSNYLGGTTAMTTFLNSVDPAAIYSALQADGLTNAMPAWQPNRMSGAPSYATVQSMCNNWTRQNFGLSQRQSLIVWIANDTFSNMIDSGFDGGLGMTSNRSRGKIVPGAAAGMPFRGPTTGAGGREVPYQIGMVHGFRGGDDGGTRVSALYSLWDHQPIILTILAEAVAGLLDRNASAVQSMKTRADAGMQHLEYCCEEGYNDWAHGGSGTGNQTPFGGSESSATTNGFRFRWSLWKDVIKPWLDG